MSAESGSNLDARTTHPPRLERRRASEFALWVWARWNYRFGMWLYLVSSAAMVGLSGAAWLAVSAKSRRATPPSPPPRPPDPVAPAVSREERAAKAAESERLFAESGACYARGNLVGAEALVRRAIARCEEAFGVDSPLLAEPLNALGSALFAQHRYAEAEVPLRRALKIVLDHQGEFGTAITEAAMSALLNALAAQNKQSEGVELARQLLELREGNRGRERSEPRGPSARVDPARRAAVSGADVAVAEVPLDVLIQRMKEPKDLRVRVTSGGEVEAECKRCEVKVWPTEMDGVLWFVCAGCQRSSFLAAANLERDAAIAARSGGVFEYELFYPREQPGP